MTKDNMIQMWKDLLKDNTAVRLWENDGSVILKTAAIRMTLSARDQTYSIRYWQKGKRWRFFITEKEFKVLRPKFGVYEQSN